jgi:hypothetical protein
VTRVIIQLKIFAGYIPVYLSLFMLQDLCNQDIEISLSFQSRKTIESSVRGHSNCFESSVPRPFVPHADSPGFQEISKK